MLQIYISLFFLSASFFFVGEGGGGVWGGTFKIRAAEALQLSGRKLYAVDVIVVREQKYLQFKERAENLWDLLNQFI